jgi:hypothetical protein
MRRIVIMGAGGRDFHDFAVLFRDDPDTTVVAFTAAQIPGIADRTYPASLAGTSYPQGIPIVGEEHLATLVREHLIDEVVLAYSDLSHVEVMHRASIAMAAGADFRLVGPRASMLRGTKPVVAVCATRTGAGKSQTTRRVGRLLSDAGLQVALVRHPMPYGDLEAMRVQRFATLADIDAANPTIEEREEYEEPVRQGMVMYAGVDYQAILRRAEAEADVIVWDGGNNDFPFFTPELFITVTDPLRSGDEVRYHPGEVNLRMADVVVVNKVDLADPASVSEVVRNVSAVNPTGDDRQGLVARDPRAWAAGHRAAGAGGRGRPDADPRGHAVRCGHRGRAARRRRGARGSPAVRGRVDRRDLRPISADRAAAAGDGLRQDPDRRARGHDRGDALRRGGHRHPHRPGAHPADRRPSPPRHLRAARERPSQPRRRRRAADRTRPRRPRVRVDVALGGTPLLR